MNFISKIKENIEHGGIKLSLSAPKNLSLKDSNLNIFINITNNSKETQTIKKVTAEIQATENNSGYGLALNNAVQDRNTTNNNEMYNMETIIIERSSNSEVFVIQPNETKSITINLLVNNPSLPKNGIAGHIKAITKDVNHFKYKIHTSVDVDGIKLDPHANQEIKIS